MKSRFQCAITLVLLIPVMSLAAEESSSSRVTSSCTSACSSIEISELIAKVAKRTGKQFIVDPRVRAEIPLIGLDANSVDYPKLLSILAVHMFVAYEAGGVVRVVPDANARQLPIPVTSEVPAKASDDEMVTVVVQVKTACAAYIVPVVRPLMPQSAHLAAMPPNALIIVDRAANARRIVEVIERLDKSAVPGARCGPEWPGSKSDSK